jgi:hypothetical protein
MPKGYSLSQDMVMDDPAIKTTLNGQALDAEHEDAFQYTVQISIEQQPNAVQTNGPPNLRAYIFWSTDGKQKKRWVSVGGGCAITGSAEAVTVQLQDFSGTPVDDSGTLADYDVYVAAVPGSRPNSSTGPTLIPLDSEAEYSGTPPSPSFGGTYQLNPQQQVNIQVPQNVGVQSVAVTPGFVGDFVAPSNASGLLVTQYDVAGHTIKQYFPNIDSGFIPLAPQATLVVLANFPLTTDLSGTNEVTNGSKDIIGTGTVYTEQLKIGDWVAFLESSSFNLAAAGQVETITDDTHFTFSENYGGASGASLTGEVVAAQSLSPIIGATLTWGIEG